MAKLTLIGMFNHMGGYTEEGTLTPGGLFEFILDVPPIEPPIPGPIDWRTLTKTRIAEAILDRAGEFEALYSDPEYMQEYIGRTFTRWAPTFKRWTKAMQLEYDPISNYDRTEETEVTSKGISKLTKGGTISNNGSNTSTPGVTTKTTQKISAYDGSELKTDSEITGTPSGTDSASVNNTETFDTTDTNGHDNTDITKSRIKGNIGVTTSQQMLQSEIEVAKFNLYNQIADVIVQEICIMVY